MSRTVKGSKSPGWEPWSNLRERQEEAANYGLREHESRQKPDYFEEVDEALYCHYHGPCAKCRDNQ